LSAVTFQNVVKKYGTITAVNNVSLEIQAGELCSLVGPSGCGKTTLLRVAAGFAAPDSGVVLLNGRPVTNQPPNKRNIGFVFQNYAQNATPRNMP
jgi:ABC-type sugar transport system ATPase subunit